MHSSLTPAFWLSNRKNTWSKTRVLQDDQDVPVKTSQERDPQLRRSQCFELCTQLASVRRSRFTSLSKSAPADGAIPLGQLFVCLSDQCRTEFDVKAHQFLPPAQQQTRHRSH